MCWMRLAEPQDVFGVALKMREKDYEEISSLRWEDNRQSLAESLSNAFSEYQNVYSIGKGEECIAIFCYVPLRKGVWSLGMFATDNFQKVGKFLTKRIIRDIIPALLRANAHRVEVQSISGYEEVHNWIKFFGFKEEAKMQSFGKNGEDFVQFSWVKGQDDLKWGNDKCV